MPTAAPRSTDLTRAGIIVLAFVALRLVAAAVVPLSPDETYYFDWSRYPDWSYYDHPPMVAWWIWIGTAIFGDGAFGIRAFTVFSAIPISLATWLSGEALFDRAIANRAVIWVNVTLLIGVGGLLATPDAPSVMFWALATWALAALAQSRDGRWWLLVGLFAGLGILSKLTNLFLGVGILAVLLADRDLRRQFLSPWLWAGALVALLVVAPFLMWNAAHDWVTLGKQFGRIAGGGLQPLLPPEFIATQFGLLNPLVAIFAGLAAVVWIARRRPYPLAGLGVLMWSIAPLVAYMAFHAFHQRIEGNWPAPIYPTLALAAAAAAEAAPARWAGLRALTFPFGAVLVTVGLVLAGNPGGVLPSRLDPGLSIRGWEHFAVEAEALREANGAAWIATTGYFPRAELAYHLRASAAPVIQVTDRVRYAYAPPPDATLLTRPVLVVVKNETDTGDCFVHLTKVGTIERRSGNAVLERYTAFRADGASPGAFAPGCDDKR